MVNKICPKCEIDLSDNLIGWKSERKVVFDVVAGREKIKYTKDSLQTKKEEGFYCKDCNTFLSISENEAFNILRMEDVGEEDEEEITEEEGKSEID